MNAHNSFSAQTPTFRMAVLRNENRPITFQLMWSSENYTAKNTYMYVPPRTSSIRQNKVSQ